MSTKKEIFLIPYAHLDTQWRWEYPTTIKKYIKNTLTENIALFEKYPKHRFNFAGAIRYAMMKEYYPDLYQKAIQYIKEGRWFFAGPCLDETDPLTPSVESLIRNLLYGDRWAKEEYGQSTPDYMLPDCFGFPANMPTILAHCGVRGFSTQKLTWNSANGIPFEIGRWMGPDGSEIISAFNPGSYADHLHQLVQNTNDRMQKLEKLGNKNGIWKSFQYYGVGDIGGAPTEGSVKNAIASMQLAEKENTGLVIRQGSPAQFFSELTEQEINKMDRYAGDLLLIQHSAGTLTSAAAMKRWNRKNEQMAFAAEVAAVTAGWASGFPYPDQKIKSAWYRTIGNQMHDILPGTSTPLAYEYSHNDEVVALNTWSTILDDAATAIAPIIKGNGDILLFNPLGESRKEAVDIEFAEWDEKKNSGAVIIDADGKSMPIQIRKNSTGSHQITFIPELKPCSWSRFSLSNQNSGQKIDITDPVTLITQENLYLLENAFYRVTVSKDGKVNSIFHKKLNKELLKSPLAYEFQKERPMQYPSWNMDWADRKKAPFLRIECGGSVSVLESGPLRCSLQIIIKYKSSVFVKEISLSHDAPTVDFVERIHWRGMGCSLKLALNTNLEKPTATFNWETSRIQREINHENCFEMPSRYWADVSDQQGGISILNDSKYGFDRPQEDTLRMTLLYTPGVRYVTGFLDQKYHDWGDHTIRYALFGHEGTCTDTDRLARALNLGIRTFFIKHDGSAGNKIAFSLVNVSNDQIGILAIKKPENQDGILVRLYERHGKSGETTLNFISEIQKVTEVNGIEAAIGDVAFSGNTFKAKLDANQIRAYIITLKGTRKTEMFKQVPVQLDYNCKMIGPNGDPEALFPKEIMPTTIPAGNISYQIAIENPMNAVKCQGQKIAISPDYNTLSLLIGAKDACDSRFKWVDQNGRVLSEVTCHISALTGFRGQWDRRKWLLKPIHHLKYNRDYAWVNVCIGVRPGFINRDRLEWYATHTHKNGEDQAYQYGYLSSFSLDVPKEAKAILLPTDSRIQVFAMTASQQNAKVSSSQYLRDAFDF